MEKKKLNVVIADDNLKGLEMAKLALSQLSLNFECSSVYNGLQLIDFLKMANSYKNNHANIPDLILLDVGIRFMNGVGVLLMIAKDPILSKIPIYVISHSSSVLRSAERFHLGARAYYQKPDNLAGYRQIVAEIIGQNSFQAYQTLN